MIKLYFLMKYINFQNKNKFNNIQKLINKFKIN